MKYYIEEIVDWHYNHKATFLNSEKTIYFYGLFTESESVKPEPDGWGWYTTEILHKTTLLAVRTYNALIGKYNHRPNLNNEIIKKDFEKIEVAVYKRDNQPIEAENDDEAIEKFFNMKLNTP